MILRHRRRPDTRRAGRADRADGADTARGAARPVALVTATIPGTSAKFQQELVRQVQAEGYDVCVISSPGPELDELAEDFGVRTRSIPMMRDIAPLADLVALLRWLWVCLVERPSLLISATPKASLLSLLAGRATGVRHRVYCMVGLRLEGEQGRRRQLLVAMERLTSWASTEVVANSPSLAARYGELRLAPEHKLRQTSPGSDHGIDSGHFSPREPDLALAAELGIDSSIPVVGFVGRLTHDKGIDCLISAMALLHRDDIACQLLVVGGQTEPDSATYLEKLTSVGQRVVAIGMVDDIRPYFGLMNVHVLPSLREGFPNVVLEASAMGLPTVTTDATGAIDSVKDHETGFVVRAQDPQALAVAVRALLGDPDLASQYGQAARSWVVADFQPEAVVRTLLAFGEGATDDAPEPERGAGQMTSAV